VLDDELPNPLPASITAITREYIELDLLVFDSIPKQASSESQAKATRLITEHNLNAVADEMLTTLPNPTQSIIRQLAVEPRRGKPSSQSLQALRHRLLSLALDNGLNWLLAFPAAMRKDTSTWLHGIIGSDTNPALTPATHSLLAYFNPRNNPEPTQGSTLATLTQALTTLLDARFYMLVPNPRRLPLSPTIGTTLLTSATSNRAYIAVPAALAHLPAWFDRAWLVEPFDPAGPPEDIRDLLPPPDLRAAQPGEEEMKVEDVLPVLDSDHEDRRVAVNLKGDGEGWGWRLRRRQGLCGACEGGLGGGDREGDKRLKGRRGVMLLRKQRVYGAEDYPWGQIYEALRRVFGDRVAGV
jgi:hypothetical protein